MLLRMGLAWDPGWVPGVCLLSFEPLEGMSGFPIGGVWDVCTIVWKWLLLLVK